MTEAEVERMMIPQIEAIPPMILPANDDGTMSPYPTVVMVMTPHQTALGRLWNCDLDLLVPQLFSAYKVRLEKMMTGIRRMRRRRPSWWRLAFTVLPRI